MNLSHKESDPVETLSLSHPETDPVHTTTLTPHLHKVAAKVKKVKRAAKPKAKE